jgi:hypothetical protein
VVRKAMEEVRVERTRKIAEQAAQKAVAKAETVVEAEAEAAG